MNKSLIFAYNKTKAFCQFCDRTRNPHPEYDEPIVTTKLEINKNEVEVCINCYYDLQIVAKNTGNTLMSVIKEKHNMQRLFAKLSLK